MSTPDAIVVGAGIAGLVATHELVRAGKSVLVLDPENRNNLGGRAFWSLGGLFFVDSPEQRRMGIKDSRELALADWLGSAGARPPRGRGRRGHVGTTLGRGVRRLRGHREARLPAGPGAEVAGLRRLGRAW
ncbi:FAD-binding protein [Nocardioides sp. B-3]|uniref:FAD-binding protein n=1 Tax=Nocardioides sp. B-3 TaxID=2895565 RepID=UPI002152EF8F|nr:FAD-binding protein [Nocardioides sp. B-3]UUZ61722.1 FAD-binding protein [Nocardioides sp. B-3]